MLSLKTIALKTFTFATLSILALSHTGCTTDPQRLGESITPTLTNVTATANDVTIRKVQFLSDGTKVAGNLYLPATTAKGTQPAIVVDGPQTSVKEQVPAVYAQRLAEQGFIALTFDHRTFGDSSGEPRQFENPAMKVEDIRSAVAFVRTLPEVQKNAVGLLGVCSGGGYTARAAASDPSINSLVTVAGFYHDPQVMRQWLGKNYEARVQMGKAARIKYNKTGQVDYMTNVDPTNSNVAMPGQEAYEYYGTSRGARPGWQNRSAVMFFEPFLQFNAINAGRDIKAPTLVVHSDKALVPDGARRFFASIPANKKELYWMTSENHIAFYDQPKVVEEAVGQAANWFKQTLVESRVTKR